MSDRHFDEIVNKLGRIAHALDCIAERGCKDALSKGDIEAVEARLTCAINSAKTLSQEDREILDALLVTESKQTKRIERLDAKTPPA